MMRFMAAPDDVNESKGGFNLEALVMRLRDRRPAGESRRGVVASRAR